MLNPKAAQQSLITQDMLQERPGQFDYKTLGGARYEYASFLVEDNKGNSLGAGGQAAVAMEIPKGEVWVPLYVLLRFNAAAIGRTWNDVHIELCHQYRRAIITNPPDIDWTTSDVVNRVDATQVQTGIVAPGVSANAEWYANHPSTNEGFRIPVWPELSTIQFIGENGSGVAITFNGIFIIMEWLRVPLGSQLLEELREESIPDLEIQRRLQGIGAAHIAQLVMGGK